MTHPTPLEFFSVVVRPTRTLMAVALAIVACAAVLSWTTPDTADQAAGFALLYQMFAASTGYRDRAVRGHFDPMLAGAYSRLSVARAHLAVSMLPGAIVWTLITAIDFTLRGGHYPTTMTPAGLGAFGFASGAAWCASLRFGRYAGGAVWTLLLLVLASTHHLQTLREVFLRDDGTWMGALSRTGAALVCPILPLARPAGTGATSAVLMGAVTVCVFAAGIGIIVRMDVPLEDPS